MPADAYDLLIPIPREIKRSSPRVVPSTLENVTRTPARDVAPSDYRIEVGSSGATLHASDDSGFRSASATLAQLRRAAHHAPLSAATIDDGSALPGRGVMLDVSRCRIPRNDELGAQLGVFAGLKLNHLQLYTEHTFAYEGHEAVWRGHAPITPAEIRRLDDAAHDLGLELAANQNCFGHLASWLRHPEYAHLAETHGDWSFAGMPRSGPFSLCPTDPASLELVRDLLGQLLPCFRSGLVNIGCDETYDIGTGLSKTVVESRGKAAVYAEFVAKVCEIAREHGRTPMFWADVAQDHPEALQQIPGDAAALVWGYEPTTDFGAQGAVHAESGRAWWVCPGTSSWRSFTGRSFERRENIRNAARTSMAHGAAGLLVCDWGDVGHRQVWPIALMGIAEAADAAWSGRVRAEYFLDAVSLQVFGDPSGETAKWIEALGDTDEHIRAIAGKRAEDGSSTRLANATALFTELHPPPADLALPSDAAPWSEVLDRLTDLAKRIPSGAGPLIEAELRHAVECALFAARVAIFRRDGGGEAVQLGQHKDQLVRTHRRLWKARSRLGGLDESTAHWTDLEIGAST